MKYFFLVGERSGDLHAANLAAALKVKDTQFTAKGLGGDRMKGQGIELIFGLERLSFMGFWEVLTHLWTILQNFRLAKKAIQRFQPDVVILVDNPGFNMRMAKWCKQHGYKVVYYILPQVWAWNENRIYHLQQWCDRLIGVLPFEKEFYDRHKVEMNSVGHPLLDEIAQFKKSFANKQEIAVLPGSRKQEITRLMPVLIQVARYFPNELFTVAGLSKMKSYYSAELPANLHIEWDQTYELLQKSEAAIVCSGTATLETALFGVPQVVIYKTGFINYQIGKRLANVDFISLPNLIAGKKVVEELIQQDCSATSISQELKKLLMRNNSNLYDPVMAKVGGPGASARSAEIIYRLLFN